MTRHRAVWGSTVWWPASSTLTALNPIKRKNVIATWHWCQLDCYCNHQISTSIIVKCWWHCVFFCQRTIVDADHRGRWTEMFGSKAPQPETSGSVATFTYPTCISCPRWEWFHRNFADNRNYLLHKKLQSPWAIVQQCLRDPMCSSFDTTPACDRQTRDNIKYRASTASRGQKYHLMLRSPSFSKRQLKLQATHVRFLIHMQTYRR